MDEEFAQGVALFNSGQFWEAHEHWENCWRGSPEPASTFFKGIIQAAAALVHWQRGNPRGLQRNWYKARPKLVALDPQAHPIDTRLLITAMDAFITSPSETLPRVFVRNPGP